MLVAMTTLRAPGGVGSKILACVVVGGGIQDAQKATQGTACTKGHAAQKPKSTCARSTEGMAGSSCVMMSWGSQNQACYPGGMQTEQGFLHRQVVTQLQAACRRVLLLLSVICQ